MDSDDLARMYAQIVRGVTKEESRFVTDEETGALWDSISAEVDEIRKANPQAQFDIPNEVPLPTPGDGPVERDKEPAAPETPPGDTPAEDAPPADKPDTPAEPAAPADAPPADAPPAEKPDKPAP